ncbi:uncharacterized protein LOC120295533 [Eucalyptus grandis]|uniref:uncharacterized protein LOC120295533 n=1 Tax=Eucalyptus grandis TaxID=71139 RepID=UPI00192EC6D8|nr:uncharacterized protein LOC120295533 [Eucalyptus grandis]
MAGHPLARRRGRRRRASVPRRPRALAGSPIRSRLLSASARIAAAVPARAGAVRPPPAAVRVPPWSGLTPQPSPILPHLIQAPDLPFLGLKPPWTAAKKNGYGSPFVARFGRLPEPGCSARFEESRSSRRPRRFGSLGSLIRSLVGGATR